MSNKNGKESVRLRRRKLKDGSESLYLDIYINGKREYEYLKIYLSPETTKEAKAKNKEKLAFAEAVLAKRIVELRNGEYGFRTRQASVLFYDYYVAMCEKKKGKFQKKEGRGNWGNWMSCLKHLEIYEPRLKKLTFSDITPKWIEGFKRYLEEEADAWTSDYKKRIAEHKLGKLTAHHYFTKLMSCVKYAMMDGLLPPNTLAPIENIKAVENERNYLTIDELKKLVATPCPSALIRRSFLFSCLTGLRRSDILNLKWGNIQQQGEFTRLVFTQQKTGGLEYIDITPQAVEYLGERRADGDLVFEGMYSPTATNRAVQDWVNAAEIKKKITFHCARHTFAVMMLDLGADLYVVSKLMGHRDITTTQVYAKVLDKNKQAAVAMIPQIISKSEDGEDNKQASADHPEKG